MAETLPLFPEEPSSSFQKELSTLVSRMGEKQVYFGTSSWKYQGWLGQIYSRERYMVRGRFSKARFAEQCLSEYAETFSTVCGDFAFYQFPVQSFWRKLFNSSPKQLQFSFKVPEEITTPRYPSIERYGNLGGADNPNFLNPEVLCELFLKQLDPYSSQIAVLIFEFGAICGRLFTPTAFTKRLDRFLGRLPRQFRFAVEIRNPEFLAEAKYVGVLRRHSIAHVMSAWTRMPPLQEQIARPDLFTTDFTVVRALLKPGRKYEDAVRSFTPYRSVQDPDPNTRSAIGDIVVRSMRRGEPTFIYVNNRLEGNAPMTIHGILEDLPD